MNRALLCAFLCLLAGACAYPVASVTQGAELSHLRLIAAPKGTTLWVDERLVGERSAAVADVFSVEPGVHTVEERFAGRVLSHKSYLLSPGASVDIRGDG